MAEKEKTAAPETEQVQTTTETSEIFYDAYYVKMIMDKVPDGTAISANLTVRDIIFSIVNGQGKR